MSRNEIVEEHDRRAAKALESIEEALLNESRQRSLADACESKEEKVSTLITHLRESTEKSFRALDALKEMPALKRMSIFWQLTKKTIDEALAAAIAINKTLDEPAMVAILDELKAITAALEESEAKAILNESEELAGLLIQFNYSVLNQEGTIANLQKIEFYGSRSSEDIATLTQLKEKLDIFDRFGKAICGFNELKKATDKAVDNTLNVVPCSSLWCGENGYVDQMLSVVFSSSISRDHKIKILRRALAAVHVRDRDIVPFLKYGFDERTNQETLYYLITTIKKKDQFFYASKRVGDGATIEKLHENVGYVFGEVFANYLFERACSEKKWEFIRGILSEANRANRRKIVRKVIKDSGLLSSSHSYAETERFLLSDILRVNRDVLPGQNYWMPAAALASESEIELSKLEIAEAFVFILQTEYPQAIFNLFVKILPNTPYFSIFLETLQKIVSLKMSDTEHSAWSLKEKWPVEFRGWSDKDRPYSKEPYESKSAFGFFVKYLIEVISSNKEAIHQWIQDEISKLSQADVPLPSSQLALAAEVPAEVVSVVGSNKDAVTTEGDDPVVEAVLPPVVSLDVSTQSSSDSCEKDAHFSDLATEVVTAVMAAVEALRMSDEAESSDDDTIVASNTSASEDAEIDRPVETLPLPPVASLDVSQHVLGSSLDREETHSPHLVTEVVVADISNATSAVDTTVTDNKPASSAHESTSFLTPALPSVIALSIAQEVVAQVVTLFERTIDSRSKTGGRRDEVLVSPVPKNVPFTPVSVDASITKKNINVAFLEKEELKKLLQDNDGWIKGDDYCMKVIIPALLRLSIITYQEQNGENKSAIASVNRLWVECASATDDPAGQFKRSVDLAVNSGRSCSCLFGSALNPRSRLAQVVKQLVEWLDNKAIFDVNVLDEIMAKSAIPRARVMY